MASTDPCSNLSQSHQKMESPEVQQPSCYNGVSSRSRGWKTWKPEKTPQSRVSSPTVMRWNGASRSSEIWDYLRRDPELWFRDGDCYVHLHAEGQSRRGASFKVPYSTLVEAKYQPLINSFISRTRTNATIYHLDPAKQPVELFIPAPPKSDKRRSYNYHLATRNLFAFIFRRSMVGECLGSALITLYNSLRRFRTPDADNLQDLMSYMDEEGYLDLNNQPTYALAMLHLAETFQLRGLYIDAFAHCCGMSERIFLVPGFQLLSSATRTSLRRARREMYCRLGKASTMLNTFLRDELYEDDIEVDTGAKEHLDQFRDLLREFYTMQFGCYPPPSIDAGTTIFEAKVFRAMRSDFEALCEFLEDRDFDIFQSSDFLNDSQSFTLRSIQSFDARYSHETLFHPLPLLPDIPQKKPSFWKLSWWNMPTRASKTRRAETLVALARATNPDRREVIENHLVTAYRKFEEDQITSPIKSDKLENPGPIDGRKTRWILIYAIYQTLRRAADVALEVRDATGTPYHVCISTASLPPWEEEQPAHTLAHTQQDHTSHPPSPLSSPTLEAKSDHEYLTPTDQTARDTSERPTNSVLEHPMSRGPSTLRRSFSLLTKQEQPRPVSYKARRRETISLGSDNKMMPSMIKKLAHERSSTGPAHPLSSRTTGSPASEVSNSSCYNSNSETTTSDTPNTSATSSPVQPATEKQENELASIRARCGLHEVDCDTVRLADRNPPALSGKRTLDGQGDTGKALEPAPLDIRKERKRPASIQMPSPQAPTAWDYIQAVMEIQASNYESAGWDQFTHLGDFIEVGSDTLAARRASTFF